MSESTLLTGLISRRKLATEGCFCQPETIRLNEAKIGLTPITVPAKANKVFYKMDEVLAAERKANGGPVVPIDTLSDSRRVRLVWDAFGGSVSKQDDLSSLLEKSLASELTRNPNLTADTFAAWLKDKRAEFKEACRLANPSPIGAELDAMLAKEEGYDATPVEPFDFGFRKAAK